MTMICKYYDRLNYTNPSTFPDDFLDVVDKIRPNLLLWNCMNMGGEIPCDNLFRPILTDEGVCYTYNMLDRKEIFKDNVSVEQKSKNRIFVNCYILDFSIKIIFVFLIM